MQTSFISLRSAYRVNEYCNVLITYKQPFVTDLWQRVITSSEKWSITCR